MDQEVGEDGRKQGYEGWNALTSVEEKGYLEEALKEAYKGLDAGEVPVGCVVVGDGEILAREHNRTMENNDPLAHAEFLALEKIIESSGHVENLQFYITIEPCVMCHGILRRAKAEVVFGSYNDVFGTKKIIGESAGRHVQDDRCIEVLKKFYTQENLRAPEEKRISKAKRGQAAGKKSVG